MRKLLLAGVVVVVAVLGAPRLVRALAPDETRIRWRIADAVEAFNAAGLLSCMRCFAADYRDATADVDHAALQGALLLLFTRRVEPQTQRFRYRAEVPAEELRIEVGDDRRSARATFLAHLLEREHDSARPVWSVRVEAELRAADGEWRIARSRHTTLSGRRPR